MTIGALLDRLLDRRFHPLRGLDRLGVDQLDPGRGRACRAPRRTAPRRLRLRRIDDQDRLLGEGASSIPHGQCSTRAFLFQRYASGADDRHPIPPSACAAAASAPWMRDMLAEHRLHPERPHLPLFICEGIGLRGADRLAAAASAAGASTGSPAQAKEAATLGIPCVALFPNTPARAAHRDAPGSAQPRQSDLPGDPRDQGCGAGDRRADRRRARSLHRPRP